jgi:hypothetical protein
MNDYHSDYSAVSKTMLNLFCKSRLEYFHTYISREMLPKSVGKPAMVGTILHAMLLEDKAFEELVLPYPESVLSSDNKIVRSRADAFEEDNPGFIYMKEPECDAILCTVTRVLANEQLATIVRQANHREMRFDATIEGVDCKCKPDIVCDLGDKVVIYDLKCMEQVDPDSWQRSARRFRYWLQDSHYSSVLEHRTRKPVQFRFCVIETTFPYRVQWKWYDPVSRETARDVHRGYLKSLRECMESGEWGDEWPSVCVLTPWDVEVEPDNAEVQI